MQRLDGICFSIGRDPDPEVALRALMLAAQDAVSIRTYSPEKYYPLALQVGLDVVPGIWIDEKIHLHQQSLDELIEATLKFEPSLVVVGNETMMRNYFSPERLIECIRYVRERVPKRTLVTTGEDAEYLLKFPKVMEVCDVVGMHHYPFWHGVRIEHALNDFDSVYRKIRIASGYKDTIVLETGWPSDGGISSFPTPFGVRHSSEATLENATRYFHEIMAWSKRTRVPIYWFEAFNELWKKMTEGEPGMHWGLRACAESRPERKFWLAA